MSIVGVPGPDVLGEAWLPRCVGVGLVLSLLLPGGASATTLRLVGGLPAGFSTSSNVGAVAGGVGITDFSGMSGNLIEGTVDLTLLPGQLSLISGQQVTLGVIRQNAIEDGDFEAGDLGTSGSAWTEYGGAVAAVSSGHLRGNTAELSVPAGSSTDAYIQQYFPANPGDVFRLSYRVRMDDTLPAYAPGSAYGTLDVRARYSRTNTDAGVIHPASPEEGYSGSLLNTDDSDRYELIVRHTSATGTTHVVQSFAIADCDEHVALDDGSRHIGFYRYVSSSCDTDIQYGVVTFNAEARAPASESRVEVDDVMVDWVRQVEVQILDHDAAGVTSTVIQSTTVDTGFYVEPLTPAEHPYGVTFRVVLRSHESGVTPILRQIDLRDAVPVQVVVGNALAIFDQPRIGADMHIPPRAEFDAYSSYGAPLSTLCHDPLTGGTTDCYTLFADYGVTNVRMFLDPADFDFVDDGTDWAVTPNADGLDLLQRISEAIDHGLDPILMLPAHGPPVSSMNFWNEDCTDVLYDDLHSTSPRDDAAQSRHLFRRFAQAIVEGLDGTHAEFGYVEVDDFEILNEPNYEAFEPYCTNFLPADDLPLLIAEVAEDLSMSSRTGYHLAFGGIEPDDAYMYDTDWLENELLPALDPLLFTHAATHPYTKTWAPETIRDQFSTLDTLLDNAGWSGLPLWFTEYAYKRATYDPDCSSSLYNVDQSEWIDRGYGDAAQAKLMARATLAALSTSAEKILAWGQMSNEMVDDVSDPCWASLSDNKVMFQRVEGTGAAYGGVDPVELAANDAGLAWLTLSRYLSTSNPLQILATNVAWPGPARVRTRDEHVEVPVYEIPTGYVAAVYSWKDYDFGKILPHLGESTEIAWQSMVYDAAARCVDTTEACGVRDVGFREKRVFTLTLLGLVNAAGIDSVRRVPLDGSFSETPLDFSYDGSDALTVREVVAGELPVLVVMEDLR